MTPFISIITLNYNQADVTCEFLQSLRTLNYQNFEVIVVDNNSAEDPFEKVTSTYPEAKYIQTGANLGFAGGNNIGIRQAKGDYLFLVNNDTEVTPPLLDLLLAPFQEDEQVGMVSPKIKYHEQPDTIQYAGFTTINPYTGRNKPIGGGEKDTGQYDEQYDTGYCHGAAVLVSKAAIDKAGLIPEEFFLCYEELDWSVKVKNAGFKILYEGNATIFHKESLSIGKKSPLKTYFYTRNRILFMKRNYEGATLLAFYLFMFLVALPKSVLQHLMKRQGRHLKSLIDAILWNVGVSNQHLYIGK